MEAKHDGKPPGHGLAQAKGYADTLGLQFAYSINGHGIVAFDAYTRVERAMGSDRKDEAR